MKKFFTFCAAMLVAFAVNAETINIDNSTANALQTALNSAATGDVIEMAAGIYEESGNYLAFTGKELTVRAADGADVLIKTVCPVRLKEGAKAEFVNVKFDCSVIGNYEYVIVAADDTDNKRVVLNGCEFYGWDKNKAMIEATSSRRLASVTIDNCYFHDCMKSVVFIENTGSIALSITNSTFANISTNTESFWAGVIDSRASSGTFTVDHCTFYNVKAMSTDYAAIGKVATPGAVVSNCIFAMPTSTADLRAIRDVATANNCLTYNYTKDSNTGIHSDVTKNNCIFGQDPLFKDAAHGNYTLSSTSPARAAGTAGSDLGDPRWLNDYTVVGDEDLCGSDWNTNDENNNMIFINGAYRWTSEVVYFDNGNDTHWGFKVLTNHSYDGEYPAGYGNNYVIDKSYKLTSGAGYYKVEVAYVPTATNRITVNATYLGPKVAVRGGFTGWTAQYLEYDEETGAFTKAIAINTPDLYEAARGFKLQLNDDGANEVGFMNTITRTNCTDWLLNDKDNNCGLKADVPGNYIFTYYYNEGASAWKLNVTYPTSFTRTVDAEGADKYQTLCVPFDASVSGATVYAFGSATESGVTINSIAADALEAGKSYLIMPEGAGDIVISAIADGDTVIVPEDLHGLSGFYGILGADYEYVYADNNFATYVLQDDNKFHKVIGTASATITSTHAYLHVASGITAPALRIIMDATNIENLEAVDEAVKFVKNGQLFIKKNGVVYNAVGAVVK